MQSITKNSLGYVTKAKGTVLDYSEDIFAFDCIFYLLVDTTYHQYFNKSQNGEEPV